MREVVIEEAKLADVQAFHELMREGLSFPSYYGNNLDALNDCLGDVDTPTRLIVRRSIGEEAEWFARALRVIERVAEFNPALDVIAYTDDLADDEIDEDAHVSAADALARLKAGNREFLESHENSGDISPELVEHLFHEGQRPYAVVLTCADSRVVPEHIFMTGLGELFVIRVAGNIAGASEMASAVYACDHLHTKLLLVLGHTHCGAIEAAMSGEGHGTVAQITDAIAEAIADETDPYAASVLNVRAQVAKLRDNPELGELTASGLDIRGGVYHTHSGVVDFL